MSKIKNVPVIRFKGYTDTWKQRQLSDVADRFDNLRVPISAADRIPGETPYYGANGIQDYVDGYTHDGEFLLVAEDGANDLEDYPVNYVNGKIWVNNHAHVIQSKPDLAINSFLMYAIKQIKMNQFIVGGSRAKLNAEVMMSLPITIPDIKEQLFIGDYFQGIDNLITLHQRKYEYVVNFKKAMLEKMFPKDGSDIPEIRFKEFSGDQTNGWELKDLEEVVDVYDGTHQTPKYTNTGVKFLSVENISNLDSEKYISEEAFNNEFKVFPEKGDVLMTRIGDVGTPNVVETDEKLAFYVSLALLKTRCVDPYFLKSAMLTQDFKKKLQERTLTTAVPQKINLREIGKTKISISNIESEQVKIGDFFNKIDRFISLYECKLRHLKNIKKALLEKMLV